MECFDKELSEPIRFKNPSGALLARLVLSPDADLGLNIKTLDVIISIIRTPEFNSREVTFDCSGDIYEHVARVRAATEASTASRSLVVSKPAQDPSPVLPCGISEVIVDGVIDVLKAEMLYGTASLRLQLGGIGQIARERRYDMSRVATTGTLASCSLVHLSWLSRARRALGVILMARDRRLSLPIQNPCFGSWTREMQVDLQYHETVGRLAVVLRRLSSLHFLQLNLSAAYLNQSNATMNCNALSPLYVLDELVISLPSSTRHDIIRSFCEISLPSLRTIRFEGICSQPFISGAIIPNLFLSLFSMPSLQSLCVHEMYRPSAADHYLHISHIEWKRDIRGSITLNELAFRDEAPHN